MTGIDSSSGRNSASDCKYVGPEFKLVRSGVFSPTATPFELWILHSILHTYFKNVATVCSVRGG